MKDTTYYVNFTNLSTKFKSYFIDKFSNERIIDNFIKGNNDNIFLRGIVWKQFLNIIPKTNNISEWIKAVKISRDNYYIKDLKLLKFNSTKQFKDPLSSAKEISEVIYLIIY